MTTKLRAETARLLELHPHLHVGGYGGRFSDEDRQALLAPEAQRLLAAMGIWISCNLSKAVKVNHKATLARLRATLEIAAGGVLSDGLAICALLVMGFDAESLSCRPCFNITQSSLDAAIAAQRPKRCKTGRRIDLVLQAKGNAGTDRTAQLIAKRFQRFVFAPEEGKDSK